MSSTPVVPGAFRLTAADWLAFPDDGQRYEVVDGELYVTPPPATRHQVVCSELGFLLQLHLRASRLGQLIHGPVGVRSADDVVVEPDLVVVLAANTGRIRKEWVLAPPDLVVEVLSPGTARRDLVVKRELYERGGVAEYWVVDPEANQVEVLVLEGGRYRTLATFGRAETLRSALLPGLELPLAEAFPPGP